MLAERILSTHLPPAPSRANVFAQLLAKRPKALSKTLTIDYQLTDFIRALALLVRNGVPPMVAFAYLGPRIKGSLGDQLAQINRELELGASLEEALELFAQLAASQLAQELCQKVSVSVQRGTPLADQLEQLALSSQEASAAHLLRQAGGNETKMLIPTIFVILPTTVLFAIYPSLSLLGSGF